MLIADVLNNHVSLTVEEIIPPLNRLCDLLPWLDILRPAPGTALRGDVIPGTCEPASLLL